MEVAGSPPHTKPSRDRWLYLILLLALALRTYHLAYPPWDYHNWRQTNTLMVARDFAHRGFDLLHPQVAWVHGDDPSKPSYFSGEFSIESVLAGVLFKVFGESDLAARLVVISFSLLGIYFLYLLLHRHAGPSAARTGALFFALLPYSLFFGRVFMPDVPSLALVLGGLTALDRWTEERNWQWLLAATILTALALLQKLTTIIVALPMLYLFWVTFGRRLLIRWEPYGFAALAALPAALWYTHAATLARASGFSIMPTGYFARHLGLWLHPPFVMEALRRLAAEAFSPLGLALVVAGLLSPGRGRVAWIFRLWILAGGTLLLLIPETLGSNYYYYLLVVPAGAGLAGLALGSLAERSRFRPAVVLLLVLFTADALRSAYPLYQPDRSPYDLGVLLRRLTAPHDLIATENGGSPTTLYASDRRGWIEAQYDLPHLEQLSQAGARYFASTAPPNSARREMLFRTFDERYERLTARDAPWSVYFLGTQQDVLHEIPGAEIQNPFPVNFQQQIELLGTTKRELLAWPTSFELTYYWQRLKPTSKNLRVFVHFTTPEGRIVFQQDHWPLENHHPAPPWNVGDVMRERYVVILPGDLQPGRYQLRVGWFDPVSGDRLPIVSPGASDGEGRAIVAEFEVPRPPRYRWFSVDY